MMCAGFTEWSCAARIIAAAAIVSVAVACGEGRTGASGSTPGDGQGDSASLPNTERGHPTLSVQVGSFADSSNATAMRDSLDAEGWVALVVPAKVDGAARWRVHILPTTDSEIAELVAAGLRLDGRQALVSHDQLPESATDAGMRVLPVNRGTHGMAARTRWALSPDRSIMLAVEDPTAVEAEPVLNGFVVASEKVGSMWQHDGVWDASPSPDWRVLAYVDGYVIRGAREGRIRPEQWQTLATRVVSDGGSDLLPALGASQRTDSLAKLLSAHSFPASGMDYASGVGVPRVVKLDSPGAKGEAAPQSRTLQRFDAWRVRWVPGDTLAVGVAPRTVQDYSPPSRYVLMDLMIGTDSIGAITDTTTLSSIDWASGPVLDISVAVDMRAPRMLHGPGVHVESQNGWIRVTRAGESRPRMLGPGMPLGSTANGRFIVALAPNPEAARYESANVLVVYQVF